MKYTEERFEFPMKIYDGFSLRKAMKKEEDTDVAMDGDWVEGRIKLPVEEIMGWFDTFSKGRSIDDVFKEGFDAIVVITYSMGEFECTWNKEKFEKELNTFYEKYRDNRRQDIEEEVREIMIEKLEEWMEEQEK